MKKKLISLIVFSLLFVAIGFVMLYKPAFTAVQDFLRNIGIYTWLKDNFYDFYYAIRYGKRGLFVVVVFAIIIISLFVFKATKAKKVNDDTMKPINVNQTPYIHSKNGKPTMVVIEEKGDK